MNNTKERRRGKMRNWRGKAVLAGYIALCVLLIILAAIISLRLSAQEARAGKRAARACLQLRRAGCVSGGSAGRGGT